jgi:hypothetical protein
MSEEAPPNDPTLEERMAEMTAEYQANMQALMDEAYPEGEEHPEVPQPQGQVIKNPERLQEMVNQELRKLGQLGLNTHMVEIDGFTVETQLKALIGFLFQEGILSEEQYGRLNIFYGNMYLDKLRHLRTNAEQEMTKAKVMEGLGGPGIVGPNGERLI